MIIVSRSEKKRDQEEGIKSEEEKQFLLLLDHSIELCSSTLSFVFVMVSLYILLA
jgi:hypothetical protein